MGEIYFNGKIITMSEKHPHIEAVYVENGIIKSVGTVENIMKMKKADTSCIDLQGYTMLPGFIDGHSHFTGFANTLDQCDLSQAKSFKDIYNILEEFISENQIEPGEWIIGNNYDHNFMLEKTHPDKKLLDEISDKNPIMIVHASSHMGVVNTLGLCSQNLDETTEDPEGGRYGRDENTGELTGYMEENAFINFRNRMPAISVEKLFSLMEKAQKIYASYGVTTVQEGMTTEPLWQLLMYAASIGKLNLDIVAYLDIAKGKELIEKHSEYVKQYQKHLKIGGFKTFLDGSPQGKTAWMKESYVGEKDGYRGYPVKTDEQLAKEIETAVLNEQQLLAHCNGDAAAEQYITQFEKIRETYPEKSTCRPVMVHAQFVQEEQLKRMKKIGMMPSFFAAHTYYWGDIHIQNTGYERAAQISPTGSAQRLGIPFTLHQDCPVLPPNMLDTIWCTVKRETKEGQKLDQKQSVSVYEALKALTVYAAYQYGEEAEKGTIESGKRADFVVLNKNPLQVTIDELKTIAVLETIKDGTSVYKFEKL